MYRPQIGWWSTRNATNGSSGAQFATSRLRMAWNIILGRPTMYRITMHVHGMIKWPPDADKRWMIHDNVFITEEPIDNRPDVEKP